MIAILLIQAGYAAVAVAEDSEILASKMIRKYMVRKSQGKSQISFLESKGKSRLGSRIRLAQTTEFFSEINAVLNSFENDYDLDKLYLSCSPKLRGAWMQSQVPIDKDDSRWIKIPHHVERPTQKELNRILHLILNPVIQPDSGKDIYDGSLASWCDWQQWAQSDKPKEILEDSLESEGLHAYIELLNLIDVPQDPEWHPEGDVWIHTMWVVDAMRDICERDCISGDKRLVLMLAALCHDLGKSSTTEEVDGRIRSRGHELAGVQKTETFLKRLECPAEIRDLVKPLVKEHLVYASFTTITKRAIRRLKERLQPADMGLLKLLIEADQSGRPPLPRGLSPKAAKIFEFVDDSD